MQLSQLLQRTAGLRPDSPAVRDPSGIWTYKHLDEQANRIARALQQRGVRTGDRVAVFLEKTSETVAVLQAVLRCGAAYVPIDPTSAFSRAASICNLCDAAVVCCSLTSAAGLISAGVDKNRVVEFSSDGMADIQRDIARMSAAPVTASNGTHDLAYILCTSGSTGVPKLVCISHQNAWAFIEWALAALEPGPRDQIANHAPFHFDLSVFDLYASLAVGATLHIVPRALAFAPSMLVDFMEERQISIWYSVPTALSLMVREGGLLDRELPHLRAILFAGEPFPIAQLRPLWNKLSKTARFLNLYGPTETNVCTAYELTDLPASRTAPPPIGKACSGDRVWARKSDGSDAAVGEEGELIVSGPTVMMGYWGQPAQGVDYATGDWVRQNEDGNFEFIGRRDGMVKIRGHRVELGEIESALARHPQLSNVVVTTAGDGEERELVACLVARDAHSVPSLLEIKRYCAEHLPRYMIIDRLLWLPKLPQTANGKIDRRALTQLAAEG